MLGDTISSTFRTCFGTLLLNFRGVLLIPKVALALCLGGFSEDGSMSSSGFSFSPSQLLAVSCFSSLICFKLVLFVDTLADIGRTGVLISSMGSFDAATGEAGTVSFGLITPWSVSVRVFLASSSWICSPSSPPTTSVDLLPSRDAFTACASSIPDAEKALSFSFIGLSIGLAMLDDFGEPSIGLSFCCCCCCCCVFWARLSLRRYLQDETVGSWNGGSIAQS
mmetsp:Transcript_21067/g.51542  ORF Transcript_21067/g.51542 Transcript_21067/m.51542 type:complete len:223 (+) Transcript_21067:1510-2178(+)